MEDVDVDGNENADIGRRKTRKEVYRRSLDVELLKGVSRLEESMSGEGPGLRVVRDLMRCYEPEAVRLLVHGLGVEVRLRDVMQEAFERLAMRRQAGLRGIMVLGQLYDAVMAEAVEASKLGEEHRVDALFQEMVEHACWLCGRDASLLLKLVASEDPPLEHLTKLRRNYYSAQRQQLLEHLVVTRIFRTTIQDRFTSGTQYVFRFEIALFAVLATCFTISVPIQRQAHGVSIRVLYTTAFQWWLLSISLPPLHYFSTRVVMEMQFWADLERATQREHSMRDLMRPDSDVDVRQRHSPCYRVVEDGARYLLYTIIGIVHRAVALATLAMYGPFIIPCAVWLCRVSPQRLRAVRHRFWAWFFSPFLPYSSSRQTPQAALPRRSLCGNLLPKTWRRDPLNWIELVFLLVAWFWFIGTIRFNLRRERPGHQLPSFNTHYADLINFGYLAMWFRVLGFLRNYRRFACFVTLLTKLVYLDLRTFFVVLFIVWAAFSHTIYMSAVLNKRAYNDFRRDRDDSRVTYHPRSVTAVLNTVYLYVFTAEGDSESLHRSIDKTYVAIITFVMIIIVLNVRVAPLALLTHQSHFTGVNCPCPRIIRGSHAPLHPDFLGFALTPCPQNQCNLGRYDQYL